MQCSRRDLFWTWGATLALSHLERSLPASATALFGCMQEFQARYLGVLKGILGNVGNHKFK